MRIEGKSWRTIMPISTCDGVDVIDQTLLPHSFALKRITSLQESVAAIKTMVVRGAPLIGATAAYGLAIALRRDPSDAGLAEAVAALLASRPTAVNLRHALEDIQNHVAPHKPASRAEAAWERASAYCEDDVRLNRAIGEVGFQLLAEIHARTGKPVNVLTHCNAGWLATVDWGTATAPIYVAQERGVPVHVFVDETRPRNQGASLTAYELRHQGVPHTLIADNAGGHLMQRGEIDLCIVGADRISARGDAANKIGTYLKALAAHDNNVPFYVAAPTSTIDLRLADGLRDIEIEERSPEEVTHIVGRLDDGKTARVLIAPPGTPARNPAFDVTPARLVTAIISDRGICAAEASAVAGMFEGPSSLLPIGKKGRG